MQQSFTPVVNVTYASVQAQIIPILLFTIKYEELRQKTGVEFQIFTSESGLFVLFSLFLLMKLDAN